MLKSLARLLRVAFFGVAIAGVAGAVLAKRRIVPVTDPAADEVVLAGVFGRLHYQSSAARFRGGSIECWFGGGVVDLRGATLDPGGGRLTVRAVCGGGQLLVPPTWHVVSQVRGIGGVDDVRPAATWLGDAPSLTIEGLVVFGGFAVDSANPDASRRRRPDWPRATSPRGSW